MRFFSTQLSSLDTSFSRANFLISKSSIILFFYLLSLISAFFYLYQPKLNQFITEGVIADNMPYIWDALYYHEMAKIHDADLMGFLEKFNLTAIIFYLDFLSNSPALIFVFNVLLFYSAIFSLLKRIHSKSSLLALLLFISNPFLFVSLLQFNKDLVSLCSVIYLTTYIISNRKKFIILSLVLALIVRFELFLVLSVFLILYYFNITRFWFFLLILLGPIIPYLHQNISLHEHVASEGSLGLNALLNSLIQDYSLYPLAFFFKALNNLFGPIIVANLYQPEFYSSILFLVVLVRGIFSMKKCHAPLRDFIFIYLVLVSHIEISHHRYYLPLWPAFVFVFVQRTGLHNMTLPNSKIYRC